MGQLKGGLAKWVKAHPKAHANHKAKIVRVAAGKKGAAKKKK